MDTPKILLVDDTMMLLEIGKSFLAHSAVRVLTARNGEEALEIITRERPNLVILDQHMPKMNGTTCCAVMRRDPALRTIPVIMISGSTTREDCEAFEQAGCKGFLAKPLVRQHFLAKVRAFLPTVEQRVTRVPCRTPVAMEIPGASLSGVSYDISSGGLYVATDYEAAVGRGISLRFRLPDKTDNPLIVAKGRIAWLNSASHRVNTHFPVGIGVEFLEITGEGLAILRKSEIHEFVESCRESGAEGKKR
jgi:CheY-like chemotaxis protein/Tfp pilus assembly protein PilZ